MQTKEGELFHFNGKKVECANIISDFKTFVASEEFEGRPLSGEDAINMMVARRDSFIPENANAYALSNPNPCTQTIIGERKCSVYAIQFYNLIE